MSLPDFAFHLWDKQKKGGGADGYIRSLDVIVFGGTFLIALLAYLDNRNNKPKK